MSGNIQIGCENGMVVIIAPDAPFALRFEMTAEEARHIANVILRKCEEVEINRRPS